MEVKRVVRWDQAACQLVAVEADFLSVHQPPQKKQNSDQGELVWGNSDTTFDPPLIKNKTNITHVQWTVTVQNDFGTHPSKNLIYILEHSCEQASLSFFVTRLEIQLSWIKIGCQNF